MEFNPDDYEVKPSGTKPARQAKSEQIEPEFYANLEKQNGLKPGTLKAIEYHESRGNDNAVSTAGAKGRMQFMGDTANQYGVDTSSGRSSIAGAAKMLGELTKKYGNQDAAISHYNGGANNAQNFVDGTIPSTSKVSPENFKINQAYVKNVNDAINFDPSKFEVGAKQTEFDPSQFEVPSQAPQGTIQKAPTSLGDTALAHGTSGLSLGLSKYATAAMAAGTDYFRTDTSPIKPGTMLPNGQPARLSYDGSVPEGGHSLGYLDALKLTRANEEQTQADNPKAALASKIAGGVATGAGLGTMFSGLRTAGQIGLAGGEGAISGATANEHTSYENTLKDAGLGGLIGGIFGGAGALVQKGARMIGLNRVLRGAEVEDVMPLADAVKNGAKIELSSLNPTQMMVLQANRRITRATGPVTPEEFAKLPGSATATIPFEKASKDVQDAAKKYIDPWMDSGKIAESTANYSIGDAVRNFGTSAKELIKNTLTGSTGVVAGTGAGALAGASGQIPGVEGGWTGAESGAKAGALLSVAGKASQIKGDALAEAGKVVLNTIQRSPRAVGAAGGVGTGTGSAIGNQVTQERGAGAKVTGQTADMPASLSEMRGDYPLKNWTPEQIAEKYGQGQTYYRKLRYDKDLARWDAEHSRVTQQYSVPEDAYGGKGSVNLSAYARGRINRGALN